MTPAEDQINPPAERQLDTRYRHETPEGIELVLTLAGPLVRGLAWAIDFAIRAVAYLAFVLLLSLLGGVGTAILLVTIFLIEWFYPVFFEMRSGSTPGKKIFALRVIQADGSPLTWSSSLLRNLLRAADFLPFLYATGFLATVVSRRFQRLGDLAAGTIVVYEGQEEKRTARTAVPARPLPWPLDYGEQMLVLRFAERSPRLSAARRRELAAHLAGFTGREGTPGQALLAHASWLRRGRG